MVVLSVRLAEQHTASSIQYVKCPCFQRYFCVLICRAVQVECFVDLIKLAIVLRVTI